jgi:hypothetical protein
VYCLALHGILFFYYPFYRGAPLFVGTTNRDRDVVLLLFYLLKCYYFYYSALQIQCGYPPFSKEQYLTKNKDSALLALIRYFAYRSLPFLFEIKTILDWACTVCVCLCVLHVRLLLSCLHIIYCLLLCVYG